MKKPRRKKKKGARYNKPLDPSHPLALYDPFAAIGPPGATPLRYMISLDLPIGPGINDGANYFMQE